MTVSDPAIPPRPLRILHIMARLNIGGTTPYLMQLIAQQRAIGNSSRLICGVVGENEGDMHYLADRYRVDLTVLPSLGREISPLRDLQTLWLLFQLIRKERPDIVHTHTAKAGFIGRIAAWLARTPVIVHTFHGHVFNGYFSPAKTKVYLWLERLCARLSTRIIVLSQSLKRELCEVYHVAPAAKFEIVELGFDLRPYAALDHTSSVDETARQAAELRARLTIPADAPLVGIVGRIVGVKNHQMFLQVAQLILKQRPDAYFVIIGDGDLRTQIEAEAQTLGISDHLRFAGWITDLTMVYRALDLVLMTSLNEGLPVSLIEAMAAGVPVIATRVGGVPDLLENGELGGIVASQDSAAMAAQALDLLRDGKGSARVQHTREVALSRYSIETSAGKTDALYRKLLKL